MPDVPDPLAATPLPKTDPPTVLIDGAGGAMLRGRYVALVPGEDVPLLALDLPPALRGVARENVAHRQMVDLLGPEAAALQMRPFAPGDAAEGWDRVLAVDRGKLALWRGQAGRRCVALLPDYLAVPVDDGQWSVAAEQGRIRVRFGPVDGATTSEPVLCLQAAQVLAWGQRPDRVLRYGDPLPVFEAQMAEAGIPVVTDTKALSALRAFAHGELSLDLRADPQAARTRLMRQIGAWRWPVLTGALAAGLWAAAQLTVIHATQTETATLTAATLQTTRDSFVPVGPILDIRVQVSRVLSEGRAALRQDSSEVSPLDLFATAAPVIADAGAEPQSVTWEADGGLRLVLHMADFAAVDALVDALAAQGLRVSVRDARLTEGSTRVVAELDLTPQESDG